MTDRVPVLLLSGSMGAGKTTVMGEIADLLIEADVSHAALDFDWLWQIHPHPGDDPDGSKLAFRNLKAIWPNYRAAGVERLVIARAVEHRAELAHYRDAIPGAEIVVCRLTAPIETMHDRLRLREPGIFQPQFLARSTELERIQSDARLEDFAVANGPDRNITVVAREVLLRAGWR